MQQRANTLTGKFQCVQSCTKNGGKSKDFKNLLVVDLHNDKVQLFEVCLLEIFMHCSYETPMWS